MRITVGGVLLFFGGAGFLVLGPLKWMDTSALDNQIEGLKKSADWITGYFKSTELPTSKPDESQKKEPVSADAEPIPINSPVESNAVSVETKIEEPPAVTQAIAPVVKETPRRRRKVRKSRAKISTAKVETPKAVSPKPAQVPKAVEQAKQSAGGGQDKLVGTYVSLKLKTGREVKGIYQGKDSKQYTIELPGMGPFTYPLDNVVSVGPAE